MLKGSITEKPTLSKPSPVMVVDSLFSTIGALLTPVTVTVTVAVEVAPMVSRIV